MRKLTLCLLMGITLSLVSSCWKEDSSSVNQDKIWTEYYLEYDEATGVTSAKAVFKFSNLSGTLLQLSDSAYVTFNGEALAYNQLLGYYEKQYPSLVTEGTFEYVDLDSTVFENAITMANSVTIPAIDTLYKSAPYSFVWIGEAVQANERINVWIDSNVETDTRLFTTDAIGSTSIIFPLNQISSLGVGPYGKIGMERVYQQDVVQKTSAGGMMSAKYTAKSVTEINIAE